MAGRVLVRFSVGRKEKEEDEQILFGKGNDNDDHEGDNGNDIYIDDDGDMVMSKGHDVIHVQDYCNLLCILIQLFTYTHRNRPTHSLIPYTHTQTHASQIHTTARIPQVHPNKNHSHKHTHT